MPARGWGSAVFLASVALIAGQIVLMQALAQAQGHHFAYLVISLALLGFGCSGTVLALGREWLLRASEWLLPALLLGTSVGMALGLGWAQRAAAEIDFHLLFVEWRPWIRVPGVVAGAFAPFFLGALALGLVFTREVERIGRFYGANLAGSAAGAAIGLGVLFLVPPERAIPLLAMFPAVAAWLGRPRGTRVRHRTFPRTGYGWAIGASACLLLAIGVFLRVPEAPMSPYKAMQYSLQLPDSDVVLDRPHPMGRLQVVTSPALRYGPGLSLHYRDDIPAVPHLYRDGDSYGAVVPPPRQGSHILEASVMALPLALRDPERALLLHGGGGAGAGLLLHREIPEVTAVEPHPIAARLLRGMHAPAGVDWTVETRDARAFLNRPSRHYDLVVLPVQGAFGGGLGLRSIQEDYLLTVESFERILGALREDGILTVSVYIDQPPRAGLKALGLLVNSLRAAGIERPAEHVAAARSWDMLTLVASPQPFEASDRSRLADFTGEHGFDRAWIPGFGPAPDDRRHVMQDDRLAVGVEAILSGDRQAFEQEYPFRLQTPRDNQPYFHQFVRLDRLDEVRRIFGAGSLAFVEIGSVVVVATVILLGVAAAVLICLPLLRLGWARGGRGPVFAYFSAIGLGFMFLEIVWIQRFTLFWGNPLYAAAGVIVALLCGMGIGSALSGRMPARPRFLRGILGAIVVVLLALLWVQPAFFAVALAWPEPVKWATGLLMIGIPAVLLGFAFPGGLRAVGRGYPAQVPWAWGINGCFSVLGAPLAAVIAMGAGFHVVGVSAAAAYAVALLACGRLRGHN